MKKIETLFVLSLTLLLTSCKQDATGPPATPASVAPSITQHPTNVTLMVGQTATFSVSATGTGPLSYQWQKNEASITGATNASYTLIVTVADSGSSFQCRVSNSAGSAASNPAVLNAVSAPTLPVITGHPPTNISAFAGDTVTVSVSATGYPLPSYQWRKDGINIPGATNASYTFVAIHSDSGKQLRCVVANPAGLVVSNPVLLSVVQLIQVGRPYLGGTIYWLDGAGGGLVAANYDQSDSTQIIRTIGEAEYLCSLYGDGYRMPDSTELKLLKTAKDAGIVGRFVSPQWSSAGFYGSSWESIINPGFFLSIGFNNGLYGLIHGFNGIRAVRRF